MRIDLSKIEYSDPNPELEKHPMSIETRSKGDPPPGGVWSLEDTEWILENIAKLRGSSDAFRAQDSDPVENEGVETGFGASTNRKPENAQNQILDIQF